MALLTPMSEEEGRRLLAPLGITQPSLQPLEAGSVNSNFAVDVGGKRKFFLRVYEEQGAAGARTELRILEQLAAAGVPVAPAFAVDGAAWLGSHRAKPVALFPWVAGEIACQRMVDAARCQQVGRALATIHRAGVTDVPAGRFGPDDIRARLSRVEAESATLAPVARETRRRLDSLCHRRDDGLPAGLIHGDLFRDNVLWNGDRINALLDFESASHGSFVYDLAVCVHAWCFGQQFDPKLVHALGAGYAAVRRLSPRELDAFSGEAAIAALRFVATRMTDYSLRAAPGQPPLRDYNRFLERYSVAASGQLAQMLGD